MIIQGYTIEGKKAMLPKGSFRLALYSAAAKLDMWTARYSSEGEVSGSGYVPGGKELTPEYGDKGQSVFMSFKSVSWLAATIKARGGLIYEAKTGAVICVLDFGSERQSIEGRFEVNFPTCSAESALIIL